MTDYYETKSQPITKFRELAIHKWRKPIQEIARRLNPVVRGLLNYYHKLRGESPEKTGQAMPRSIGAQPVPTFGSSVGR